MTTICEIIKKMERNLTSGKPVKLGKYATHNHSEKIAMIDAYYNSQHISGQYDSRGREKPFFNIVKLAVKTWFKATDIDRKNIFFRPTSKDKIIKSFITTIKLRDWMRQENFGEFLNKWGFALAKYGSAVSKFVEKGNKLIAYVVHWDKIICDPVDFYASPVIEKVFYTPAQLRMMPYENTEEIIKIHREARETIDRQKKDDYNEFIGVYELHGNLPLSLLTGKEKDENIYCQQMHVVFLSTSKDGEQKELTLYKGREKQSPYYLSHLIEEEGRTLSCGAVEELLDPQWMVNHSVKQIKDQLDLASVMALQTADFKFAGRNALDNFQTGDILIYEEGKPLTAVNNQSHDIPVILGFLNTWKNLMREISGAVEPITGEQMPSGTPYRLGAMLNREAHSLFGLMTENKGLHLEQMIRKFILPFFKKSLNTAKEVALVLEGQEIERFDELAMPFHLANELLAEIIRDPDAVFSLSDLQDKIRAQNKRMGNIRFLSPPISSAKMTWKDYFADIDDLEIEITGEQSDKQMVLETLSTILRDITANPMVLQDPTARMIFDRILTESGVISPLELKAGVMPTVISAANAPVDISAGLAGLPIEPMGRVEAPIK